MIVGKRQGFGEFKFNQYDISYNHRLDQGDTGPNSTY